MLEQHSRIDTPRMTKFESFEIRFERVTEEDRSRGDEVGEEEGLDFGEGENGFGESFGGDSGPSEEWEKKEGRRSEGEGRGKDASKRARKREGRGRTNLVR